MANYSHIKLKNISKKHRNNIFLLLKKEIIDQNVEIHTQKHKLFNLYKNLNAAFIFADSKIRNEYNVGEYSILLNSNRNNKKNILEYIYTIFHELGHANCYKKSCKCFDKTKGSGIICEFHAEKYMLKNVIKFIKNKTIPKFLKSAIVSYIRNRIILMSKSSYKYGTYRLSAIKLIKTPEFKCINKLYLKINNRKDFYESLQKIF